uniref:Uncharacterized protein n=1 Tax=Aegilops tauschii subsp. strangulata TaxID=200361 RepID=A0A452YWI4_AEGTS
FCCCCELCAYVFQTQQKKQAAADVLFNYSQFVMVCIGEGVRPTDLRLHLMKVLMINFPKHREAQAFTYSRVDTLYFISDMSILKPKEGII